MHDSSLMLARPEASDQLVLLLHGVGSSAQGLAPVGQALAKARPRASVVSVEAPHPSQLGHGQGLHCGTGVFNRITIARGHPQPTNQEQDQVLAAHAGG